MFSLTVCFPDKEITLERQPDRYFHCPCGLYASQNPDDVRKHIHQDCDPSSPLDDVPGDPTIEEAPTPTSRSVSPAHSGSQTASRSPSPSPCEQGIRRPPSPPIDVPSHSETRSRIVSSPHLTTLSALGIMVDPTYGVIICTQCSKAVQPQYVRAHLVSNHSLRCPPSSELDAVINALGISEIPPFPTSHIIPPIHGLPIQTGLACSSPTCRLVFSSARSYRRHLSDDHADAEIPPPVKCFVQKVYGFRGAMLLVAVDPGLAITQPHCNLSEYLALMRPVDDAFTKSLEPTDDVRKLTSFLYAARWHHVVRGHSPAAIQQLTALPTQHDPFFRVAEQVRHAFTFMCTVVKGMDVLTRRHIHTPKG
jgi:hypothetical protein